MGSERSASTVVVVDHDVRHLFARPLTRAGFANPRVPLAQGHPFGRPAPVAA